MSELQIFLDARVRPDLFVWYGRPTAFSTALIPQGRFPADLVEFWRETGGGDVFETESILGPFAVPEWGDSFLEINEQLKKEGLPAGLVGIHVGTNVTAVDGKTLDYVVMRRSDFREIARYSSFDEWYLGELRSQNAARFHLSRSDEQW